MKYDHQIERLVIGTAITTEKGLIDLLDTIQDHRTFTHPECNEAYKCLKELYYTSEGVSIISISRLAQIKFQTNKLQFESFLIDCTSLVVSDQVQKQNCLILLQYYIRRRLGEAGQKLTAMSDDEGRDTLELLATAITEVHQIDNNIDVHKSVQWAEVVEQMVTHFEIQNSGETPEGITTGIIDLDKKIGGFTPGQLITVAGRPGMGKSAFAQSILIHAAQRFGRVLMFSREMSAIEIAKRITANQLENLNMADIFGNMDKAKIEYLKQNLDQLKNLPIEVDGKSSNLTEVIYKIRKEHSQHALKVVIIDYLQLLSGFADKRYRGQTEILNDLTRELKALASKLELPIIVLSQLNREVENRPNKEPQLSDLKMSGSIEEDSNMVILLYRPEYYNLDTFPDGDPSYGKVDIIVAKNRNGKTGKVRAEFIGEKVKFQDLQTMPYISNEMPWD